jgi:hypothetical protein
VLLVLPEQQFGAIVGLEVVIAVGKTQPSLISLGNDLRAILVILSGVERK